MSDFLGLFIFGIPKMIRHIPIVIKYSVDYQHAITFILPE